MVLTHGPLLEGGKVASYRWQLIRSSGRPYIYFTCYCGAINKVPASDITKIPGSSSAHIYQYHFRHCRQCTNISHCGTEGGWVVQDWYRDLKTTLMNQEGWPTEFPVTLSMHAKSVIARSASQVGTDPRKARKSKRSPA
jgi:hypothetical protein